VSTHENENERIARVFFYGLVLLLFYLFYQVIRPFLMEIGWAIVLAICLRPVQDRLRSRLGEGRAALLVIFLIVVLVLGPAAFAGSAIAKEGPRAAAELQELVQTRGGPAAERLRALWAWARERVPLPSEEELVQRIAGSLGGLAGLVATQAGGLLRGAAEFLLSLVITLTMLFFLLRDGDDFAAGLRRLLPFESERVERLLTLTRDLVSASVTASLAIAICQGVLGGITFAILGVRGAALWGTLMGIASFIPVVGGALVWVPVAVLLLLSGDLVRALVLVGVAALVIGNVDNVLRPLLLSGSARMNTLVILVSLMGGVSAFGFIGIVLGPLVVAVLTALFESYRVPAPVLVSPSGEVVATATVITMPEDASPAAAPSTPAPPPVVPVPSEPKPEVPDLGRKE
jgi:predicted PurR-regulated permease PerM